MMNNIYSELKESIDFLKKHQLLPFIPVIENAHQPEVYVGGKKYLLFSSNSYLGLNVHPLVVKAAKDAIDKFGTGGGNSRLLSGTLSIHHELERTIAWFKHTDDALVFPAGFMVNAGVIPALAHTFSLDPSRNSGSNTKTKIYSDESNHASIIEGCRLAQVEVVPYKHCDANDLEDKLRMDRSITRKLIVTDGIFSLDGDIAPLDAIVELSKKYKAMIMVDDAHGTGVLGKTGRGVVEYFNLDGQVDVMMGTFSKALASAGGFVAGDNNLIQYLRIATRTYLFTASIPPSVAATVIAALRVINSDTALMDKLHSNSAIIKKNFHKLGFNILNTSTPVIPMVIGDERKTMEMSERIFRLGIIAPAVRYPAVPKNSARIRFTASALHKKEHLSRLFEVVDKIGRELAII